MIALAVIGAAAAWWIYRKVTAARSLEYKVTGIRVNFYPDQIRIQTNLQLTNTGAPLNLERIKGQVTINSKEVGRIDQTLKIRIRTGVTDLPLNFSTSFTALQLMLLDRKKLNINFTGFIEAEGIKLPVFYNYVT